MDDIVVLNHVDGEDFLAAMSTLKRRGVFDRCDERYIEGCASSDSLNKNGYALNPAGAIWKCPLPLLWSHDWSAPLGLVDEVKHIGRFLMFRARLSNTLPRAIEAWEKILRGEARCVSTGTGWKSSPTCISKNGDLLPHNTSHEWVFSELSVCELGANRDAVIELAATYQRPRAAIALQPYATKWRTLHYDQRRSMRLQPIHLEVPRAITG